MDARRCEGVDKLRTSEAVLMRMRLAGVRPGVARLLESLGGPGAALTFPRSPSTELPAAQNADLASDFAKKFPASPDFRRKQLCDNTTPSPHIPLPTTSGQYGRN